MPAAAPRRVRQHPDGAVDLRAALEQLREAGASSEEAVIAVVERAVASAYSRAVPEAQGVTARLDPTSGAISLVRTAPDGTQETIAAPSADFPRQAAMAAKAAIGAWLREQEQRRLLREAAALRWELVDAIVERPDGQTWWLRVDTSPALLPPEEQIPGEVLERGRHLKVIVLEARRRGRGAALVVSRSHPVLVRRLLEQEVPELASGQVVVKAIAREPGRRTKVAVHAPERDVDPEGACIGPRGVRIRAVVSQLGEEQVQIVAWSPDPASFVARALGPAQVLSVDLDPDTRTAHVLVPASQLSLAIGRAGENARLAAKLTGWRIDIRGDTPPAETQ